MVTHENDVAHSAMPDTNGAWATQRFVDPQDLRHDMHVNIVTFQPGGVIPFAETHVMEHGLYVLQGTADYLLNRKRKEILDLELRRDISITIQHFFCFL